MGLYIFVDDKDRITKRKVTDSDLNEDFQEALKYDPSLMIEETITKTERGWVKKKVIIKTRYTVYHECPSHDGSAYQARMQMSGSGEKNIVTAYLHGIINGAVNSKSKPLTNDY